MTNQPRIVRGIIGGRTEIYIPSEAGEIMYVAPAVVSKRYQVVGKRIIANGLSVPNGDETALLIHQAYAGGLEDEAKFKGVRKLASNRFFWIFNRNLWTDEGMFSIPDREAIGMNQHLDEKVLERKVRGHKAVKGVIFGEEGVRFAEKDSYAFGEMSPDQLAKDGAMIAQYGREGAKLLSEASATLRNKPVTYGLNIEKGQTPETRVSTLVENVSRLHFGGNALGGKIILGYGCIGCGEGCAFWLRAPIAQKI
mgnify:CR=1 FL=1